MVSEVHMAAYQIPALPTFTFKSEEWESWLRRFERYWTGFQVRRSTD